MSISVNTMDLLQCIKDTRAVMHKKFAWLPVKIDGQYIWLQKYWVRYNYTLQDIGIYGAGKECKEILAMYTKEQYTILLLQGKIENNKLTDVLNEKLSITNTPPTK